MNKYTDFGTKAKKSANQITLEIDGTQITVAEGTSPKTGEPVLSRAMKW